MTDENKNFKSKTIELFGKEFEVSHKASNRLNNKFLVFLGILKYYINKLIQPITKFINNIREHDFFEPFIFILGFGIFVISFFSFIFSLADVSHPSMCRKGCNIYEKYCRGYDGNIDECIINNTYFYQQFIDNFLMISNAVLFLGFYFIIGCVVLTLIKLFIDFLIWLTNKTINKIKKINEEIPEVLEV